MTLGAIQYINTINIIKHLIKTEKQNKKIRTQDSGRDNHYFMSINHLMLHKSKV